MANQPALPAVISNWKTSWAAITSVQIRGSLKDHTTIMIGTPEAHGREPDCSERDLPETTHVYKPCAVHGVGLEQPGFHIFNRSWN